MPIVPLVLLAVLASDQAAMVAKLASKEPAERTEAARSLEALKREALPALEKAMKAPDADLRESASAVWDAIERKLMTQPTLVRLGGQDQLLADILRDIQQQTGVTLQIDQGPRDELVPLREAAPISFWTALERLGLRGVHHANPGKGKFPSLTLRNEPPSELISTAGPFRVALLGLHLHRDRKFIDGPWVRIDRFGQRIGVESDDHHGDFVTFYGDLEVMVEPRMWFTQEAPARLTEARDDLLRSLVPDASVGDTRHSDDAHFAIRSSSGVTEVRTEFRLKAADQSGRFAGLRGVVPLMLHLRRPEPALIIPLSDATGKTFRCDDAEFTIENVDDSGTTTNVAMSVRLNIDKAELPNHPDRELITSRLNVMGAHQLQLTAADGTVLADSIGSGWSAGATPMIYHWNIGTYPKGHATQLRYFSMLRVRSEAPFDFPNVPLP
jgi:hypothetical protein